ncbi:MAG TPA: nitronate monooxygenase, partial [Gemmata sp.]|nr:nitronate monooxygenase [Gemmata sp.]
MEPRDLIVLSLPGRLDAAPAIAACRAGAVGVLDLEYPPTPAAASAELARLARFAGGPFGVLLHTSDAKDLLPLVLAGPAKPSRVILTGDHTDLARLFRDVRSVNAEPFFEATSLAEAARAAELGAAGVVLKGHESAGRVGTDTSFVLVQKWKRHAEKAGVSLPFWVRGGIGANTAAACLAAGATGVVLDSQLLLTHESPLSEAARKRVAGLDGSETAVLGTRLGEGYRVYSRPDSPAAQELAKEEERLLATELPAEEKLTAWRAAVRKAVAGDPAEGAWPVGQDVVNAAGLAAKGLTVAGVVAAVCERATRQLAAARKLNHLTEAAPLAKSHGTKYPVLQGPMTRVSDTAAFANAVAAGGALPFLALALLRKAETEQLLKETKAKLGAKPWGVGILGFVPNEIRSEQLEAIRAYKPPFAIIAGGRPDQAKALEDQGIPTYLHVPSPGLLKMFLKDGAKRFIFEGQECGGHIGPRASFALWESAVEVIAEHVGAKPADDLHVV